MKHLLLLAFVLLTASGLHADDFERHVLTRVDSVPVSAAARTMLTALNEQVLLLGPQPSEFWAARTRSEAMQMREGAQQEIRSLALAFFRAHPGDPLRWLGIHTMLTYPPSFITGFKPGYDDAKGLGREFWIVDEAALAAWTAELTRYESALETGADVPWEIHERRAFFRLSRPVTNATKSGPAAVGAMEKQIDVLAARFPQGQAAMALYQALLRAKFKEGGAPAEEVWGRLSTSPNQAVAERARAELARVEAGRIPLELRFTAVDGRTVDLAELRGKVVLIDFWATWCGPCLAELPNVKRIHAKYHAEGFEIIGIALENAGLRPADTAEQAATKVARAQTLLRDFIARENMPWPQYFDGLHWKSPLVKRHAITAIPTMWLLDRQGRVANANARGDSLEREVQRLLAK